MRAQDAQVCIDSFPVPLSPKETDDGREECWEGRKRGRRSTGNEYEAMVRNEEHEFFCLIPFFTSLIASASNTFLFVYKRSNDTFKFTNYRFVRSAHDHGKTIAQLVFQWSV